MTGTGARTVPPRRHGRLLVGIVVMLTLIGCAGDDGMEAWVEAGFPLEDDPPPSATRSGGTPRHRFTRRAYVVAMTTLTGKAGQFLALHHGDRPLLQPNAWDAGSAKVLATLGFEAIATTSAGFAATLGRADGSVRREEALAHGAALAAAVSVPVAADTENGFADEPAGVADLVTAACATGLAGCSIEDFTGRADDPIYDLGFAQERIAAAVDAAHRGPDHLVLTARAENHIRGRTDLADTITRLQGFQEAGADVLFAPGIGTLEEIRAVVSSVDRPVNVLALPGCPPVEELAQAGVARVSVGSAFSYVALGGLIGAATELRDHGTFGFWDQAVGARGTIHDALDG